MQPKLTTGVGHDRQRPEPHKHTINLFNYPLSFTDTVREERKLCKIGIDHDRRRLKSELKSH